MGLENSYMWTPTIRTHLPVRAPLCWANLLLPVVMVLINGCADGGGLPSTTSDDYIQTVSLFTSAVARIQVGEDRGAEYRLLQATSIAPGEPSLWYNLGLLAMRQGQLDNASDYVARARELIEGNSAIELLSGHVAKAKGAADQAESFYREAVASDPSNLRALFALEQFLVQRNDSLSTGEALDLVDRMLDLDSGNLGALVEQVRVSGQAGNEERIRESIARLGERIPAGAEVAQDALRSLQAAMILPGPSTLGESATRLENVLKRYSSFRDDHARLQPPANQLDDEMSGFLLLANPPMGPAPSDRTLDYTREPVDTPVETVSWISVPVLKSDGIPSLVVAGDQSVQVDQEFSLLFPEGMIGSGVSRFRVVPVDYDYDYRIDLALAGVGGFRMLRHNETGGFEDVTATLGLSAPVLDGSYRGGWTIDLDSEGDMDLILGVKGAAPIVLRNNGDGSFQPVELFGESIDLKDVQWLDADDDGDADAFLLSDDGSIRFYLNAGAGRFDAAEPPSALPSTLAMIAADINDDGYVDLLSLTPDGRLLRITPSMFLQGWALEEVAIAPDLAADPMSSRFSSLLTGDLDNNGTLDVLASVDGKTMLWLKGVSGELEFLTAYDDLNVIQIMDLVGIGRQDLVGVDSSGKPVQMMNVAENTYKSRTMEPQTVTALGDRRINSYGIGGSIEMRVGLRMQHRLITTPIVHFGLGEETTVEAVRIHWPNGVTQSLFDLESDQAILAREGLNSSCPWLYASTPDGVVFLEDFLMRSPLGFRLSESALMPLGNGEDRIKLDGHRLSEADGVIDLRLAAELWETIFVDHLSLVAVDHPVGTEFYLDETFATPQPPLEPILMDAPVSIAGAWDENGKDVVEALLELDTDYVHGFPLAPNLGRAEEHVLEIDLGRGFNPMEKLWLVAEGWLRAGTSSINLAVSQAREPNPEFLILEYLDEDGRWKRSTAVLGIPWGNFKSLVVDLAEALPATAGSRIRLRTNLEIYWNRIFWAADRSDSEMRQRRLDLDSTDLRYRGFSSVEATERWIPGTPSYEQIEFTKPIWLVPSGYYTRYGDVAELLGEADDRYAIMSPGDELAFRFDVPEPLPSGWTRDYILIGSGWTKDGSQATMHSTTVRPLPSLKATYPTQIVPLEEDPVYRRFASDWEHYHTRYVARGFAHEIGN